METQTYRLGSFYNNELYMKREDLFPYSFGGNKARKAKLFFDEIDRDNYDCIVTYGSSHSNHCRIIANMAVVRNIPCFIICASEVSEPTFNSKFMELFGAKIIIVSLNEVSLAIEQEIERLKTEGKKPYFIPGGGHGRIGTQAYVNCYQEIKKYERINNVYFDYIFFASGTGTTQAGLICGQIQNKEDRKIIGISIARKNPYGRDIIINSIKEYTPTIRIEDIEDKTIFLDDYIGNGYGKENEEIKRMIVSVLIRYGIPLDSTYTGKAFWGMTKYLENKKITKKSILFIHTGGTPLFFDDMRRMLR